MAGVAGVFGGTLFSAMYGSLVTSSLIRETTEEVSQSCGYKFGQEEETYNIVANRGTSRPLAGILVLKKSDPIQGRSTHSTKLWSVNEKSK